MAKRSASTDKLTIKNLSADDQAWLKEESDRLGCDPENLVRMMIRQRSAAIVVGYPPPPPNGSIHAPLDYERIDQALEQIDRSLEERDRESADRVLNEDGPSLDQLMAAGPLLLDEPPPPPRRPPARNIPLRSSAGVLPMRREQPFYPRGGFDAFSETEFVGINRDVIGANAMGDARGNVMRDNMRHFGVAGTRSR